MRFMWIILVISFNAFSGTEAFLSPSQQKLFIEEGMKSEKDVFYVKFTGVKSAWNEKVFKVKKTARSSELAIFSFDYKLELSSGIQERTYQLVTEEGKALVNGSMVKRVKLWNPEFGRDGIEFIFDTDLTKSSQDLKLEEAGKKKPFVPEII